MKESSYMCNQAAWFNWCLFRVQDIWIYEKVTFSFHVQGQSYQFKAPRFGLSTAPMKFTVLVKDVELMAVHKGITTSSIQTTGWSEPNTTKPIYSIQKL